MQLISLTIKNFRVLKEAEINFPDRVIGIIGRNGAGKSSIIEAIAWALYGNPASRTGKDEIKSTFATDDENCEVNLTFSINSEVYRIERHLIGKSSRAEVQLFRGVGSESVGVVETKNYIEQIVGLDWRGFLSSFLARQSELNALSDLPPAKRRDHIAGMLGISKLDKAIDKTKSDIKSFKESVTIIENLVAGKDSLLNQQTELSDRLEKLKPEIEAIIIKAEAGKILFEKITSEYQIMTKKQSRYLLLNANAVTHNSNLKHVLKQIEQKTIQLKEMSTLHSEAAGLEKETAILPELKLREKKMLDDKIKLNQKNEIVSQQTALKQELDLIENQLNEKEALIDQNKNKYDEIPESIFDDIDKLTVEIETSREQYTQFQATLKALEKEQINLKKQLESIDELGSDSICDRCLRPLGDDINDIRTHLNSELSKLEQEQHTIVVSIKKVTEKGQGLKEKLAELGKNKETKEKLTNEIKSISTVAALIKDNLVNKLKQRDLLVKRFEEVEKVDFDPAEYELLIDKLKMGEQKQNLLNEIKGRLTLQESLNKEIGELSQRQIETNLEITNINSELSQLEFNEMIFKELSVRFNREQVEFDTLRSNRRDLEQSFKLIEMELKGVRKQLASFEESEKELEKLRDKHFYGEKLSALFGVYRKFLIASIRPVLADLSSDLFNEMTENKYNLVELDEDYNLRVMDQGIYYNVERFSGGEKDLANLCLRLAISMALTESAGLDRSFIILDEVFGSQDNVRKGNILQALTKLKNRFPQILLITHIEDIKEGVEQIIQVVPTDGGYSEVVVSDTV